MRSSILQLTTALCALASIASAHGNHDHAGVQEPLAEDADWATRHMAEEHHINSFDAGSFFTMHDYDNSGKWSPEDIRRTYGLFDESNKDVSESDKAAGVQRVLDIFDLDRSGTVTYAEYTIGHARGLRLPDLGFGPGHHGDDEYEYEIHHFEKYHDENTKEEDLVHPEDIAHFKKHDKMDEEAERLEKLEQMKIVESNIPSKFRRSD